MRGLFLVVKKMLRFSSNDRKVDFIIAGTQKGGTTALDEYLRSHPEICMADQKEVHYFDVDENFIKTNIDYSEYHSNFFPNASQKIIGESTPIYMYWKAAPERIYNYNPNIKIILVLRNPIDRAYSHWNMECQKKRDTLSFWDAITTESERCSADFPKQHRYFSYVDRGFYSVQIERLWQYFPKQNMLILKNEDIRYEADKTLKMVCEFLGVSSFNIGKEKDVHSRKYKEKMSIKERQYLANIYSEEIKYLEKILGWDLSEWMSNKNK